MVSNSTSEYSFLKFVSLRVFVTFWKMIEKSNSVFIQCSTSIYISAELIKVACVNFCPCVAASLFKWTILISEFTKVVGILLHKTSWLEKQTFLTSEKFVASNSKSFLTVPHGDNNMSRKLFCSEASYSLKKIWQAQLVILSYLHNILA